MSANTEQMTNAPCDARCNACSAPICPMRPDEGIYYPDEAICARHQYKALPWLKTQRKIQRRAKERNRYFTQKMLAEIRVVREGIRGADPDRTRPGAE